MKLLYIGNGASLAGVPARDLTEFEAHQYGINELLESGLYKLDEEPKKIKRLERSSSDGGE